jgi:hypothetical protein
MRRRTSAEPGDGAAGVTARHRAELQSSGLTDETIAANGIYSESDPAAIARLLNCTTARARVLGPALVFPHFDRAGAAMGHAVLKPERPRSRKDKPGKVIKYENPRGMPNRLYIPAGARAALADPATHLGITEGCKKALAATQCGFPCVSIQGTWNWCLKRPRKDGRGRGPFELIPDLAGIEWDGRRVYICYDSDAATNPSVRTAERVLAGVLGGRGADVRVVRLPPEPDGGKNGLDDFLARRGADAYKQLLDTAQPPNEPASKTGTAKPKPPSAAAAVAGVGLKADLWHDATQTAFATLGGVTYKVRSKAFRHHLVAEYRKLNPGKVPNSEALSNALTAIEAAAVHDGPEDVAHVRVAGSGGRVYLHLADPASAVVEVGPDGWRVCDAPPVRFWRPPGMLPLPVPRGGGSVCRLRGFLNLPDDGAFALLLGWLVGAFNPAGPFPALILLGEQGSAKTTTARVVKRLIDPCAAAVRTQPRDERDLMIQGVKNWVLAFDNLSGLPGWLSDAYCRLATGGGFGTRELYTNDDEVVFDAKRPLVANGIEDFITRPDLLERSILLRHPPIPDDRRRLESEFWAEFDAAHPDLLGALLDRVSAGLRELPWVKLGALPRMADFARFATACERGAGERPLFLAAYAQNQAGAHEQALDASPVTVALVQHMAEQDEWEGSATDLQDALSRTLPLRGDGLSRVTPHGWPKGANALTNALRRLAPNLRRVHGLEVDCDRRTHQGRLVRITRHPVQARETSSRPSHRTHPRDIRGSP